MTETFLETCAITITNMHLITLCIENVTLRCEGQNALLVYEPTESKAQICKHTKGTHNWIRSEKQ